MLRHILAAACLSLGLASVASAETISPPAPNTTAGLTAVALQQMQVAVNNVHLRSKPTTQSTKLATLPTGTKVDVVEMVDGGKWAHVTVGTKKGYIRADLLK
jgi:uncharacterized protein YgiM (DUF1202 family)